MLVTREDAAVENDIRTAFEAAGLRVDRIRPTSTDLEMAFATLIPTATLPHRAVDDDILAVAE